MNFEQVRQAALTRVAIFTSEYPQGHEAPYRQIGVRQQQLYGIAAEANPEYGGESAIADVVAGAVDLADMVAPVSLPERITRLEIYELDGGAPDSYTVGREITVVALTDVDAGKAPRATLRRNVLREIGSEFEGITKVQVHYPYRPDPALPEEDGTRTVEIPDPHTELLVVDLTKWYVRQALQLDDKAAIADMLAAEETGLLAGWRAHVENYAPLLSRFSQPQIARRGR